MVVGNLPSEFPVYDCSMCNKAIPTCRIRRITFGSAVLSGVRAALTAKGDKPVAAASYLRQSNQVGSAIDQVKAANPDAVIVVGPSNTVASGRLCRRSSEIRNEFKASQKI